MIYHDSTKEKEPSMCFFQFRLNVKTLPKSHGIEVHKNEK